MPGAQSHERRTFIGTVAASAVTPALSDVALEAQASQGVKPMKITLLGTGTPAPHAFFTHVHYDHCMDYGCLVLQRWDQGADRIPDRQSCGPTPIARMTEQLFGVDGVYGPDIGARTGHRSSVDVFEARGGKAPRTRPAPRVREVHAGDVIQGNGWKLDEHFELAGFDLLP